MTLRLALVSLNQAWEHPERNRELCEERIKQASAANLDLIIFPELTLTAFTMNVQLAEREKNSQVIAFFAEMAKKYGVAIVFGAMLADTGKARNTLCVVNAKGHLAVRYDKMHPFSYAGEHKVFTQGDSLCQFDFGGMRWGCSICYDLRFPEIFQVLSRASHGIINIANWPKKRVGHWHALLQARAIENQIYMIGVNRTGVDGNGLEYAQSSSIFAPDGEQVNGYELAADTVCIECSKDFVEQVRASFPVKADRRELLYGKFFSGQEHVRNFRVK